MIPKSACPLWPADNRSDLGRKARHSAASYTTYVDTIDRRWLRRRVPDLDRDLSKRWWPRTFKGMHRFIILPKVHDFS